MILMQGYSTLLSGRLQQDYIDHHIQHHIFKKVCQQYRTTGIEMIEQFLKTMVSNSDQVVTKSSTEYLNIPRVYCHHIHHTSSNTSMSHTKQLQVPSDPMRFSTALTFLQSCKREFVSNNNNKSTQTIKFRGTQSSGM